MSYTFYPEDSLPGSFLNVEKWCTADFSNGYMAEWEKPFSKFP